MWPDDQQMNKRKALVGRNESFSVAQSKPTPQPLREIAKNKCLKTSIK